MFERTLSLSKGVRAKSFAQRRDMLAAKIRLDILRALGDGPCTLENMAQKLGSTPDEILPHVSALISVKFIRKCVAASGGRSYAPDEGGMRDFLQVIQILKGASEGRDRVLD
jgi:DNA-binding transcriptional ArsR family regulator